MNGVNFTVLLLALVVNAVWLAFGAASGRGQVNGNKVRDVVAVIRSWGQNYRAKHGLWPGPVPNMGSHPLNRVRT